MEGPWIMALRFLYEIIPSKKLKWLKNQPIWNYQGGLSDGYKNDIAEKGIPDDTYKEDGIGLFRVQGTGPDNMQAIQVEAVCLWCLLALPTFWLA